VARMWLARRLRKLEERFEAKLEWWPQRLAGLERVWSLLEIRGYTRGTGSNPTYP